MEATPLWITVAPPSLDINAAPRRRRLTIGKEREFLGARNSRRRMIPWLSPLTDLHLQRAHVSRSLPSDFRIEPVISMYEALAGTVGVWPRSPLGPDHTLV
jgi:hypothetical protein